MRPIALLLLLAGAAAAAPMTRTKLDLIAGLVPKQRRQLYRKVLPLLAQQEDITRHLLEAGVDERVVKRLADLAPGALLVERYAHGLVFEAPGLTARQKTLLTHLVRGVEAAEFALQAHRARLEREVTDEIAKRQVVASTERQIREIEKRFWRIVGYALTVPQRAALKKLYPPTYATPPNILGHVYITPGLTPSQASRVQALVREYESETAADVAALQRLQPRLQDTKLPAADRARLTRAAEEATDRIWVIVADVLVRGRAVFSEEQSRNLDAIPPLQSPGDRRSHPGQIIAKMAVRPGQRARLEQLGAEIQQNASAAAERAQKGMKRMQGEIGGESPQALTMQMMQFGAQASNVAAFEEAAREAVLEILEPEQILPWVLGP